LSAQLIITGFHRSGTSLSAQIMHQAGLFLGYELLDPNPSNPYGHFEDREVVDLHQQILADNDLTWLVSNPFLPIINPSRWRRMQELVERRSTEHRLWGFKDPRACLFMMPWKYLLPDAKILLVYRHFSGPARSLARRHSNALFLKEGNEHIHRRFWQEPDLALRMWLTHNNALLAFAHAYPKDTLAVSLDMIKDGFPIVWAIERRWGLGLREVPLGEIFDPDITASRVVKQPVSDRRLIDRVEATWQDLEKLGARTEEMLLKEETTGVG
jgi:hypothetical protein